MMISEKLAETMSRQIGREMEAANQYLAIAMYFEREMLGKLAGFFYRQAAEEHEHAMKFVHYVTGAGGKVVLPAVSAPRHDLASAETAAKLSVEWETEVTAQIRALMDQAVKENDYLAQDFLRWFINEQLEEVTTMEALQKVIQRAGPNGLLFVESFVAGLAPHG
ncbi:MAG TPA: ferritin [Anaerolineales bacterium]|nr:ferritin [Anaerolineales bacterium]